MNALILSIHVRHRQSEYWRRLQPQFIAETLGSYEYGVIVNGDDPALYRNVVASSPKRLSHMQGIARALEIFAAHRHRFTHFLLLDSDCWPIRPDWQRILNDLLRPGFLYAAPLRAENFDNFPHPCAFYMAREFIDNINFGFQRAANLLGYEVSDVGAAMPQQLHNRQVWFPLLKTNYVCPHPLYASVYGDLFYHHCAGSRGLGFRAAGYKFYDHLLSRREYKKIYGGLTQELLSQPRQFIDGLRGVGMRVR
jgi:hypothetical protein